MSYRTNALARPPYRPPSLLQRFDAWGERKPTQVLAAGLIWTAMWLGLAVLYYVG